jgi:flagellar biosynthesis/type III secretory pathway protein FliH
LFGAEQNRRLLIALLNDLLPKLRQALVGNDAPAVAAWCRFLSAETDSEREALAMQHPILKDAKEALDKLSADPDALEAAERRESELWFYEHGRVLDREQGRTEGRAEGRTEGRAEGKQQTLQRQLVLKFGELPAEHQARIATSTEADLDRFVTASTLDAIFSD